MIVIVGASGSGKSTLVNALAERGFHKVITYTTRPKRRDEIDGVDYHFIGINEFVDMVKADKFAEYAHYCGWHYGTAKKDCSDDNKCIAVLTPSGLRKLKRLGIKVISIYLRVDRRSLLKNLIERGDKVDEAYRRNLSDVGQFDGVEDEVDYVIDNFEYHMSLDEVVQSFYKIMEDAVERV